jgi:hypothetical protein
MQQSQAIVAALIGLAFVSQEANAWQHERFKSGMSFDDVVALADIPARDQARVRVSNKPGTTVLQDRTSKSGLHFTFCGNTLFGISIDLKGGMNQFAQLVEVETGVAGKPDVLISRHKLMSLIVARWTSGTNQTELILQENFGDAEPLSIGKSFEDSRYQCK